MPRLPRPVALALAGLALTAALAACGTAAPATPTAPAPTAVATVAPTAVPAKPTVAPAPTKPAVVDVRSSGLGRPKADWERAYGQPDKNGKYADGVFYATFKDERVAHLERTWGDRDPKQKAFVLGALGALLPADKQLVGPVASSGGTQGELYRSEALAKAFPAEAFTGGEPGQFVVLYRTNPTGGVTSAVAALGNNP